MTVKSHWRDGNNHKKDEYVSDQRDRHARNGGHEKARALSQ